MPKIINTIFDNWNAKVRSTEEKLLENFIFEFEMMQVSDSEFCEVNNLFITNVSNN